MATPTTATQTHRVVFRELMKDVCTSIPGHVLTFDPATQTAQIQVGILRFDVNGASFEPPPIVHVPVSFAGSHDWVLEHEIQPGTEGMIHFSQRCIDGWCQTGGVADNPIGRFHDYSDAVFVPGVRSLPNAVPNWSNDGVRLRNRAGSQFVWLKADGSVNMENGAGHIRLGADGTVTINGVTINQSGLVHTGSDVTAGSVSLKSHTHGGVDTGAGNTQGPNS